MTKNDNEYIDLDLDELYNSKSMLVKNTDFVVNSSLTLPKNIWRMYPLGRKANIAMDFPCNFNFIHRWFMKICFGTEFEKL